MSFRRPGVRRGAILASTILATASMAGAAAASSDAAVTIGAAGGTGQNYEFGAGPYVASIGQVVTVPAGVTTLESFALSPKGPPTFVFRAYVYAWSGSHTTGPALYESADLHAPSESSFQPLTVKTGGVTVTPGQQYVLFLSRSAVPSDGEGIEDFGLEVAEGEGWLSEESPTAPYTEGFMVGMSNGYEPSDWATENWWSSENWGEDAAFEATFDVPVASAPEERPLPPNPLKAVVPVLSPSVAPVARCVAPDLSGLTLAAAKSALKAADCSLGAVVRHYFTLPKGEVMEQDVHHGTFLPVGGKIDVWLSRGAHVRHRKAS